MYNNQVLTKIQLWEQITQSMDYAVCSKTKDQKLFKFWSPLSILLAISFPV